MRFSGQIEDGFQDLFPQEFVLGAESLRRYSGGQFTAGIPAYDNSWYLGQARARHTPTPPSSVR